jgi:excisionase family DNA binding protein
MSIEELRPRSNVLREALARAKEGEPAQAMLTVAEACKHLRISKTKLYELIQTRKVVGVKIGKRRLITMRSIAKYIDQLEEEAGA